MLHILWLKDGLFSCQFCKAHMGSSTVWPLPGLRASLYFGKKSSISILTPNSVLSYLATFNWWALFALTIFKLQSAVVQFWNIYQYYNNVSRSRIYLCLQTSLNIIVFKIPDTVMNLILHTTLETYAEYYLDVCCLWVSMSHFKCLWKYGVGGNSYQNQQD